MKIVEISNDIINETPLQDAVYLLNNTVSHNNITVNLQNDVYDLKTTYAFEKFIYMTNNDGGLKNIAVPIIGKRNIVIDGHGATLNGIGRINPFYIENSHDITIKNIVIDYERPFFTQGEVIKSEPNNVVIKIDKSKYPYIVRDKALIFVGEGYQSEFTQGMLEYDKDTLEILPDTRDMEVNHNPMICEEIEEGVVSIQNGMNAIPRVGTIVAIKHDRRLVPAISISNSKNIRFENVWIKQAGTMGLVAQFSTDITLDRFVVKPDEKSQRVVSCNADATHFVGCEGTIDIQNSEFYAQHDDILNVHGNYLRVHKVIDNDHLILEIAHWQQVGAFSLRNGDKITICDAKTMLDIRGNYVKKVRAINNKYYEVWLEDEFVFNADNDYCIDDCQRYPRVIFKNNKGGLNRARGLLLSSRKETIIENNHLECEGAVIKISGDMCDWYESGRTDNIIIRGNKFTRRNNVVWGRAIFDIDPEMHEFCEGRYYHKNIVITDNEIELNGFPLVFGRSIQKLEISNNTFIDDTITSEEQLKLDTTHVQEMVIKDNTFRKK